MMDKVPDAIHGKAIDLACEDDRLWFDWNSDREYRLREVLPHEFDGQGTPPQGLTWRVLVVQISNEIRVRTPAALPSELATMGADDDYLAEIFKQVAPENVQKVAQAAKRRTQTK
jgi:hypothetical protein